MRRRIGHNAPADKSSIRCPSSTTCPSVTSITVKGVDKQLVGEFSAQIRSKRPAEPYNLKGIKYKDEVVRRKAGKTFVTGAT